MELPAGSGPVVIRKFKGSLFKRSRGCVISVSGGQGVYYAEGEIPSWGLQLSYLLLMLLAFLVYQYSPALSFGTLFVLVFVISLTGRRCEILVYEDKSKTRPVIRIVPDRSKPLFSEDTDILTGEGVIIGRFRSVSSLKDPFGGWELLSPSGEVVSKVDTNIWKPNRRLVFLNPFSGAETGTVSTNWSVKEVVLNITDNDGNMMDVRLALCLVLFSFNLR